MTIPHMLIQLILPIAALILTSIDGVLVHSGCLMLPGMALEVALSRESLLACGAGRFGLMYTMLGIRRHNLVVANSKKSDEVYRCQVQQEQGHG